ncbi:MAG TPA: hypothetical protein VLL54_06085 [Pyrinomonadaceae bacterium]|nr:hypothetical protein [Pyrinomonadaceae bacterium]
MRSKSILLVCLAVLWCAAPLRAMGRQNKAEGTTAAELSCLQKTTIKVANHEVVITMHDAEQIKLTVAKYLAKPKQKSSVPGPGEVFIDCEGTVRMGEWILESTVANAPELRLTFREHNGEYLIVRREIRLQQTDGGWKVVGDGHTTYHRKPL